MSAKIPGGAPGPRRLSFLVRPFHGEVVYRQVRYSWRRELWTASTGSFRWSVGVPALYTSLVEDVAIAERIKRTGAAPTRIVIGRATATVSAVADCTTPAGLAAAGVALADVIGPNYAIPQRLGRQAYEQGLAGLLVPAAIIGLATIYPTWRYAPARGRAVDRAMPIEGINLVLFPERFGVRDTFVPDVRSRRVVIIFGRPTLVT